MKNCKKFQPSQILFFCSCHPRVLRGHPAFCLPASLIRRSKMTVGSVSNYMNHVTQVLQDWSAERRAGIEVNFPSNEKS